MDIQLIIVAGIIAIAAIVAVIMSVKSIKKGHQPDPDCGDCPLAKKCKKHN